MTSSAPASGPACEERAFGIEELFFSRTDENGIILSANSVFQRISAYGWEEMVRKPHKLIRHPDMPRAVFWLLWDTIRNGQPIGAYVKNRAKDGRHYWVYAVVTPVEGGFLSVRLKPGSELFSVVQEEYAALTAFEKSSGISPAESAKRLLARLGELGFPNYHAFMSATFSAEITARDKALTRAPNRAIAFFHDLVEAAQALLARADAIAEAYAQNEYVPFNFKIQAAQLGRDGASIGEISSNYNIISSEIKANMGRFVTSAREVLDSIHAGLFLVCTANMQGELSAYFAGEADGEGIDREVEMRFLDKQRETYERKAADGLGAIARQADRFRQDCGDMRRSASGLEVTRILGKMECARLAVAKESLTELLDDLETFQKFVSNGLTEIDRMNDRIRRDTGLLLAAAA